MEILILIILGVIILFIMNVLIKTFMLQKNLAPHLTLSKNKNQEVLMKQGSLLAISVLAFGFLFNAQGYLPLSNDSSSFGVLDTQRAMEAAAEYAQYNSDEDEDYQVNKFEHREVIGVVTLEKQKKFVLVKIDDQYFMVDEQENKVIEFESAP